MLLAALLLTCSPWVQAREEKKPPQEPPAQEKPAPKDPAQEKKDPQDEKKPLPKDMAAEIPEEESGGADLLADLRIGGWWIGKFEAVIPAGRRRIDSTLMFDAGLDVRAELEEWTVAFTVDFGVGRHLRTQTGGLLVGAKWALEDDPQPFELQVSVGPIFGRLEAQVTGFGDFKSAVGFEARISATTWLQKRLGLLFWLDFRHLTFKFDEPVLMGDRRAGGAMFAVGVGLVMRF
jgi:hypothetical protein